MSLFVHVLCFLVFLFVGVSSSGENRKVSISIPSSKIIKDQAPYFATFDATPSISWHFGMGISDMYFPDDMETAPVFDRDTLKRVQEVSHLGEHVPIKSVEKRTPYDQFKASQTIREVTPNNVQHFLNERKAFGIFILCDCEKDAIVADLIPEFDALVLQNQELRDKVNLLFASLAASRRFQLSDVFQLGEEDLPALVIDNIPNGQNVEKHRFEPLLYATRERSPGNPRAQDLMHFFNDFLDGRLSLLIRSAPLPQNDRTDQKGSIVEVVADSFDLLVNQDDIAVILFVYSPKCAGSIAVLPIIQELAQRYENDPSIRIARMDGTVNDFPHLGIQLTHFPTLFLFSKGPKLDRSDRLNVWDWNDFNGSKHPHNQKIPHSHYAIEDLMDFIAKHHENKVPS